MSESLVALQPLPLRHPLAAAVQLDGAWFPLDAAGQPFGFGFAWISDAWDVSADARMVAL